VIFLAREILPVVFFFGILSLVCFLEPYLVYFEREEGAPLESYFQ
jgi:hypothetical protein